MVKEQIQNRMNLLKEMLKQGPWISISNQEIEGRITELLWVLKLMEKDK